MQKILFSIFLLLTVLCASAQVDIYGLMERTDITIQEAEAIANKHFEQKGTGRGTGYKQFQRWLYERKFHVDEKGNYISPVTEWNSYKNSNLSSTNTTEAGNWVPLGPAGWTRTSGWNPGTGRLTCIAIHPANQNIIYVSSPGGGIWKTSNGGANWQPLTDNNSLWMSVFSLTIDPSNQNIVYAGTSNGQLIKSTDAGSTWNTTGAGPAGTIRKILVHPSNSNVVFACATNGIFRSVNGGTSWTQVLTSSKEDIEFKPDNVNIMYATGNDVVRSADNGVTWSSVGSAQGITNTGRTLVSVTAANPNVVYAVQANGSEFGRLYKSVDAGLNFTTTVVGSPASGTNYFGYSSAGTDAGGQATYDMAMDVSPVNADDVYIAGIICWRSVNGGTSFTPLTEWFLPNSIGYNHADVHGLFWVGTTLYSNSDGGIYRSTDNGDNWTDLSPGLAIRQFYRIASSPTNANVITGGAQDNGTVARQTGGNWVDWLGADGMEGLVSPTNHLNLWGTSQNGGIYRTTNGGNSYSGLPRPSPGQWVTPLCIHPTNETIVYGGWTGVYKSTNSGSTWTNISAGTITTTLAELAVAPSNPNYIYASNGSTLYVTTDDGASWSVRSAPGPINDIAISPTNPSKIWIACNSASNRIYVSTDGGANFANISLNLPTIAARAIVVDDNADAGIYVGMNIGVYYKKESDASWTNFSDNLPLVAINELDIHKASGKIRVATYGRSVWESPLANSNCIPTAPSANFTTSTTTICSGATVSYTNTSSISCATTFAWSFPGGTPATSSDANPVVTYNTAGVYDASLTVTNGAGSNTKTTTGLVRVNNTLTHTMSINTASNNICANESASFTKASVNGGAAPTIQWLKNGVNIPSAQGLSSVTLNGLANGDVITCVETSGDACAVPATITSNSITMNVAPLVTHTASIAAAKTQLCAGEQAGLTLNRTNAGTAPVVTWYRNGVVIPGTAGLTTITIATPLNGDVITCTEVSNARCVLQPTITTNAVTLTVLPTPAKPIITQQVGDLLSSSAVGNQWFNNSVAITNANSGVFRPVKNGVYQTQVTVNGCKGPFSDAVQFTIEGVNKLYPVPTSNGQVTFDFYVPEGATFYEIILYNASGQLMHKEKKQIQPGLNRAVYNWAYLNAGTYLFIVQTGDKRYQKKMVVR
jgi:PKD repeat protein